MVAETVTESRGGAALAGALMSCLLLAASANAQAPGPGRPAEEPRRVEVEERPVRRELQERFVPPLPVEPRAVPPPVEAVRARDQRLREMFERAVPVPPANRKLQEDTAIERLCQYLRPIFWAEYHLARRVCEMDTGQRRAIAGDVERSLLRVIEDSVRDNPGAGANYLIINAFASDPAEHFPRVMAESFARHLRAEQVVHYHDELLKRMEGRKRAALDLMVAELDDALRLRDDQREKVREALRERWDPEWEGAAEATLWANVSPLRNLPFGRLKDALSEAQTALWERGRFAGMPESRWNHLATYSRLRRAAIEDEELRAARDAVGEGTPRGTR